MFILIYIICLFVSVIGCYIIYKNEDYQSYTLGGLLDAYGPIIFTGFVPLANIPMTLIILLRLITLKFNKPIYKIFKKLNNIKI